MELPTVPDWVEQDRERHLSILDRAAQPNPEFIPVVADEPPEIYDPSPAETMVHLSTAHAEMIQAYLGEQRPLVSLAKEFALERDDITEALAQVGVPVVKSKAARYLLYEGFTPILSISKSTKKRYGVVETAGWFYIKPREAARGDIDWPLLERSVQEAKAIVEADDYSPVYR